MPNTRKFENSITLVRVADGQSANQFFVKTNYDEILRFQTSKGISFSPDTLYFQLQDIQKQEGNFETVFDWDLQVFQGDDFKSLASSSTPTSEPVTKYIYRGSDDEKHSTQNIERLSFEIQNFTENFEALNNGPADILAEQLRAEEGVSVMFRLVYSRSGQVLAIKTFVCRNGVSSEMAKLNIGAADITAAVRESSLKFSADGLSLYNGNFIIYKPTYTKFKDETKPNQNTDFYTNLIYKLDTDLQTYVRATSYEANTDYYYADIESVLYTENDNLTIKGTIYAEHGTFSGKITSEEGAIGGFLIGPDSLRSSDNNIQLLSNYNGQGHIIANSIQLGLASLTDRLIIQDESEGERVALYNPSIYDKKVLESGSILLRSDGYLKLGQIDMYGGSGANSRDGYIRANWTDDRGNRQNGFWRINEDGTAFFNQVYMNEAHIQNSILEINTVQSVGSKMIFKDSWSIVDINETLITLDNRNNLIENDWLYSGISYYQVVKSTQIEYYEFDGGLYKPTQDQIFNSFKQYYKKISDNEYILSSDSNFYSVVELDRVYTDNSLIVTKFGQSSDDKTGGHILSIYGEVGKGQNTGAADFAVGNSLAISSFKMMGSEPQFTKRLILGDLGNSGIDVINNLGWGLYCDNAYLNGSLVTASGDKYAGINTLSNFEFIQNPTDASEPDNSRIIFWGGAKDLTEDGIQNANFQVTENGTLYAKNANIVNSIFTGEIHSANIYTAKIYGAGTEAGLIIYDTNAGISFRKELEDLETYRLDNSGFKINNKYFIDLSQSNPTFVGSFKAQESDEQKYAFLRSSSLGFYLPGCVGLLAYSKTESGPSLVFRQTEAGVEVNKELFSIQSDKIVAQGSADIKKDLWLGNKTMQYQQTEGGYDLYVYE